MNEVTSAVLDFMKGVLDMMMEPPLKWFVGVFILAMVIRLVVALINIKTN